MRLVYGLLLGFSGSARGFGRVGRKETEYADEDVPRGTSDISGPSCRSHEFVGTLALVVVAVVVTSSS